TAPGAEIHYEHTRECSPEPWLERMPDDAAMIFGYVGSSEIFDDAVCEFAVEYADQTERHYRALVTAVREQRIEATIESITMVWRLKRAPGTQGARTRATLLHLKPKFSIRALSLHSS